MRRFVFLGLILTTGGLLVGCGPAPLQVAPAELLGVPVSKPVVRQITDHVDFTGRTDAVEAVDIRARVTGFLTRMPFKEGDYVRAGQLLFEIDPRPYRAQHEQAQKQVDLNDASLKLAQRTYDRDRAIAASTPGGVSRQQLDQDEAAVQEATFRVKASEASRDIYKLNLEFTKVVSPIDGQVGRYYLTRGNLVNQDQTLLTTVVSLDPIYAYFDMDESTLIRLKELQNQGRLKRLQSRVNAALGWLQAPTTPFLQLAQVAARDSLPVYMAVGNEVGYPHEGRLDFTNNQVNPGTGSISMRGVFPNPLPPGGTRLLAPGMSARIRLQIGEPHQALLVIDRAVQSDQGQKFVYVVDKENKVQYRKVTTGALQEDGLRVVTGGLTADDAVVVGALQQVRPRMAINRQEIPMPTLGDKPVDPTGEEGPAPRPAAPKEKGQ